MIIALLGLIIMAFILFSTGGDTQTMKYSEVIDYFEQGKVSEFVLNMKNGAMQLTLTEEATQELLEQQPGMTLGGQQTGALGGLWGGSSSGAASDTAKQAVLTYTLPYAGELLDKDNLQRYREIYAEKNGGAELKMDLLPATETPVWLTMLPMLLISVLLMAGFYYFMYKQSGGGGAMNVGRAKVKDQAEQGRKATFKDVAGADEEKEELQEIVEFLKNQTKFNTLGAHSAWVLKPQRSFILRLPYLTSPRMGAPKKARCARIWCVRPVTSPMRHSAHGPFVCNMATSVMISL